MYFEQINDDDNDDKDANCNNFTDCHYVPLLTYTTYKFSNDG